MDLSVLTGTPYTPKLKPHQKSLTRIQHFDFDAVISVASISEAFNLSPGTAWDQARRWVRLGYIREVGREMHKCSWATTYRRVK